MSAHSKSVAVLLTSFNRGEYIGESVESVLRQTHSNLNVYLSDNNSTDNTLEILRSINDSRLHVFRNSENVGSVNNLNKLLTAKYKEDFIAIQHADDVWHPRKIEIQLKAFVEQPSLSASFTTPRVIDQLGRSVNQEGFTSGANFLTGELANEIDITKLLVEGNLLCMPSLLIRRETLLELGEFDARFRILPDYDMWLRLFDRHKVRVLAEDLIDYRMDGKNESTVDPVKIKLSDTENFLVLNKFFTSRIHSRADQVELREAERLAVATLEGSTRDSNKLAAINALFNLSENHSLDSAKAIFRNAADEFESSVKIELTELSESVNDILNSRSWKYTRWFRP